MKIKCDNCPGTLEVNGVIHTCPDGRSCSVASTDKTGLFILCTNSGKGPNRWLKDPIVVEELPSNLRNRLWSVSEVKCGIVEKFMVASEVYPVSFVVDDRARAELLFAALTMMTEDGHDMEVRTPE
jgi:hypothetical protein